MHTMISVVRIENWQVVRFGSDRLHGQVYNHPRFKDGEFVTTSPIVMQYKYRGKPRVRTLNTIYKLGEPAKRAS
jgi:hypothetical protein